ncbi:class I SAM-dependent methyltransferase [Paraburkholderia dinghuensis]|uniref:Class I SAM-dependent methyltransferase n=1 Tax=Paraburkholderia dinghuensis TaxID=2305225 RepID=A0A3N6MS03_9BURK|nr:class I SAM-dependent methyltransferase [Paraburkholderia dinghuensis]RQH06429.1 class I SAM-dependent methyltransferase [Paraburkholderia dinghuensis]
MHDTQSDIWSNWLLNHRHGGDPRYEPQLRAEMTGYADRLLDFVGLEPHMVLADIGTGDGLVAFRAIERAGDALRVLMTDISAPMLWHASERASALAISGQCEFLQCSAEKLEGIESASVDAIVMRAVLAYVGDKPAAMRELFRILKPGGRLAMAEPILRDEALEVCALKKIVDAEGENPQDPFFSLLLRSRAAQFPDTAEKIRSLPITNYGERDLVRFAIDTGFTDIHLELHIDVCRSDSPSWETFLRTSPHPLAPPLEWILETQFTPEERHYLESRLRPVFESGQQFGASRIAYLTAQKPHLSDMPRRA